jgi:hypothetical protein
MTFLTELRELEAKATEGPWNVDTHTDESVDDIGRGSDWSITGANGDWICAEGAATAAQYNVKLILYLRNHAKEIIALVEAAEEVIEWSEVSGAEDDFIVRLGSALAALNKEPIDPNKWAFDRGLESY